MSNLDAKYSDSNNKDPDVTIAIPTFRRPSLLKRALDSVIQQDYSGLNVEIIVLDNEQDAEIAEQVDSLISGYHESGLTLYRNSENIGMFANWELCIKHATAQWVMILNDDDYLLDGYFKKVAKYLNCDDAILGVEKIIRDERCSVGTKKSSSNLKSIVRHWLNDFFPTRKIDVVDMIYSNRLGNSTGLLLNKKKIPSQGTLFNHQFYPSSDYEAWVRLIRIGGCTLIRSPLAVYVFDENESLKKSVVKGFILQDRKIRSSIINAKGNNSLVCDFLSEALDWNRFLFFNSFFSSELEFEEVGLNPSRFKKIYQNDTVIKLIIRYFRVFN